jgi:hypothetical protein
LAYNTSKFPQNIVPSTTPTARSGAPSEDGCSMQLRCFGLACLVILILSFAVFTQPVYACSPTEPPPEGEPTPTAETLESLIQGTPIIFEGTVTAISEDRVLTTVQVSRYFKGDGPGTVTVLGFGWGTDCLPVTNVGEHAIFYTTGNPQEQIFIHSWRGIESVNDAKVDAIIKAVGHDPVLVPDDSAQVAVVALIGLGMMIGIIATIVWLKRKQKET